MCDRRERIFLLAHQRIFHQNPSIGTRLLLWTGSARGLFEAERERFRGFFRNREELWRRFDLFRPSPREERELDGIERNGFSLVSILDRLYPPLLRMIPDPPSLLIASGERRDSLLMPMVSMVGSRMAGRLGREAAAAIAEGLASRGYAVVSGMAYGIDSAAHRGALCAGGATVAVTACGPEIVYPPGNRDLAAEIARAGAIVTEFPPGEAPLKANFPQRNRIISGMALGTVIVEAAERSGSLITARFALEQNREVMAVPGGGGLVSVRGSNRLIREGAPLVESAEDVAELIDPLLKSRGFFKSSGQLENDVDMDSPLLRAIPSGRAVSLDELISSTGLAACEALSELTRLALTGAVVERAGRRWQRTRGGKCPTRSS